MTKINLLPPERIKVKRAPRAGGARSFLWMLIVFPLIVAVAMGFWFFSLNSQIDEKNKALAAAKTELSDWQAKNAQLQQYKARQEEIASIETTVVSALANRVYWARILNEIAIMCPSDIWLTSLAGSSSAGAGTVQFAGFALQCPNRAKGGTFLWYPDYRPIAGWLERMAQIAEFQRVWLGSAEPTRQGVSGGVTPEGQPTGAWVISFSSQATLNPSTAVVGGGSAASAPAPATPTPAKTTPEGGEAK